MAVGSLALPASAPRREPAAPVAATAGAETPRERREETPAGLFTLPDPTPVPDPEGLPETVAPAWRRTRDWLATLRMRPEVLKELFEARRRAPDPLRWSLLYALVAAGKGQATVLRTASKTFPSLATSGRLQAASSWCSCLPDALQHFSMDSGAIIWGRGAPNLINVAHCDGFLLEAARDTIRKLLSPGSHSRLKEVQVSAWWVSLETFLAAWERPMLPATRRTP